MVGSEITIPTSQFWLIVQFQNFSSIHSNFNIFLCQFSAVHWLISSSYTISCCYHELLFKSSVISSPFMHNISFLKIPVPHLRLHRTYGKAKGGHIILQSGLQFSCPPSVQKIVLNSFGEYEELTDNEMIYLLVCVEHSHALVELQ